ncbi:MAG: hypothetical protein HQK51_17970, partial [Oligoflexia bacterium]|nr:hypothetical protein [Oligoflexia bacterium]
NRKRWIYEEADRLHAVQKDFTLSIDLVKKYIPELLRFAGSGSKCVDKKILRSVSESITKEVYDEIWQIENEAVKKIHNLVNRKESIGEVPFFYICILDTIEAPGRSSDSEEKK